MEILVQFGSFGGEKQPSRIPSKVSEKLGHFTALLEVLERKMGRGRGRVNLSVTGFSHHRRLPNFCTNTTPLVGPAPYCNTTTCVAYVGYCS